ncbi:hypothetical protein BESB_072040 [Besnoitia besnoiti]|uniref:SNF2 family N-terminal domain-containing protein n=1 Tax=Besnoitia besnoiti TaxID=94643 RepID=A0A2A9MF92_BESBE|nr:uncharacterized protein BESB_072040 [Besnoitia besnoiti]PFH34052.1 hypothetical protein BESB_072040 [Besnoitia besnoiti]
MPRTKTAAQSFSSLPSGSLASSVPSVSALPASTSLSAWVPPLAARTEAAWRGAALGRRGLEEAPTEQRRDRGGEENEESREGEERERCADGRGGLDEEPEDAPAGSDESPGEESQDTSFGGSDALAAKSEGKRRGNGRRSLGPKNERRRCEDERNDAEGRLSSPDALLATARLSHRCVEAAREAAGARGVLATSALHSSPTSSPSASAPSSSSSRLPLSSPEALAAPSAASPLSVSSAASRCASPAREAEEEDGEAPHAARGELLFSWRISGVALRLERLRDAEKEGGAPRSEPERAQEGRGDDGGREGEEACSSSSEAPSTAVPTRRSDEDDGKAAGKQLREANGAVTEACMQEPLGVLLSRVQGAEAQEGCACVALYAAKPGLPAIRGSSEAGGSAASPSAPFSSPACLGYHSCVDFSQLSPPLPAALLPVFFRLVQPPSLCVSPSLLLSARVLSVAASPRFSRVSSGSASFAALSQDVRSPSPSAASDRRRDAQESEAAEREREKGGEGEEERGGREGDSQDDHREDETLCEIEICVVLPSPARQPEAVLAGDSLRLFFSWFDSLSLYSAGVSARPQKNYSPSQSPVSAVPWRAFAGEEAARVAELASCPAGDCAEKESEESLARREGGDFAAAVASAGRSEGADENILFIEPQFLYDCLGRAWRLFAKQTRQPPYPLSVPRSNSPSATPASSAGVSPVAGAGASVAAVPGWAATFFAELQKLREWSCAHLVLPAQTVNLVWVYVPLPSGRVLAFDSISGRYKFLDALERRSSRQTDAKETPAETEEEGQDRKRPEGEGSHDVATGGGADAKGEEILHFDAPGGMLCDQMGLGKTVEAIALMLLHPHPSSSPSPRLASSADWALPASAPLASSSAGSSTVSASIFASEDELPAAAVFDCPCGFEGLRIRARVGAPKAQAGVSTRGNVDDGGENARECATRGEREIRPVLVSLEAARRERSTRAGAGKRARALHSGAATAEDAGDAQRRKRSRRAADPERPQAPEALEQENEGQGEEEKGFSQGGGAERRANHAGAVQEKRAAEGAAEEPGGTLRPEDSFRTSARKTRRREEVRELLLPATQCTVCGRFFHLFCMGITREKRLLSEDFTCLYCESEPLLSPEASFGRGLPPALPAARGASAADTLREVKGTIVLCPAAILQQWREEIRKHTRRGAVRRTAIYMGVKNVREALKKQLVDVARRRFASQLLDSRPLERLSSLLPSSLSAPVSPARRESSVPASFSSSPSSSSSLPSSVGVPASQLCSTSLDACLPAPVCASSGAPSRDCPLLFAEETEETVLVRPQQMDGVDILLVSYDTLREELWFSPLHCRSRQYGGVASSGAPDASLSLPTPRGPSPSVASPAAGLEPAEAEADGRARRAPPHAKAPPLHAGLGLRRKKRYRVLASPLLRVHWWRLLIDEAQMVGGYTVAAQMARALSATFRWCVSGTPLLHATSACSSGGFCQNFLAEKAASSASRRKPGGAGEKSAARNSHLPKELAGLLSTLQLEAPVHWIRDQGVLQQVFQPLAVGLPSSLIMNPCAARALSVSPPRPSVSAASAAALASSSRALARRQALSWSRRSAPAWLPPERAWGRSSSLLYSLIDLLFPLFWRTNMKDVMVELGVPAPIYHDVIVHFGPVERFFYQRQQQAVRQKSSCLLSALASSGGSSPGSAEEVKMLDDDACSGDGRGGVGPTQGAERGEDLPGKRGTPVTVQLDALLLTLRHACQHPQLGQLGLKKQRQRGRDEGVSWMGVSGPAADRREGAGRVVRRRRARFSAARSRARGDSDAAALRGAAEGREGSRGIRGEGGDEGLLAHTQEGELATEFMSMNDVLAKLLHEAKLQAEEHLRRHCAATNGLAGLALIRDRPQEALHHYRHVLTLARMASVAEGAPTAKSPGLSTSSACSSAPTAAPCLSAAPCPSAAELASRPSSLSSRQSSPSDSPSSCSLGSRESASLACFRRLFPDLAAEEEQGFGVWGVEKLSSQLAGYYHVDSLQQIHAAFNLSDVLERHLRLIRPCLERSTQDASRASSPLAASAASSSHGRPEAGSRSQASLPQVSWSPQPGARCLSPARSPPDSPSPTLPEAVHSRRGSAAAEACLSPAGGAEDGNACLSASERLAEERVRYVSAVEEELSRSRALYETLSSRYTRKFTGDLDRARDTFFKRKRAVGGHQQRRLCLMSGRDADDAAEAKRLGSEAEGDAATDLCYGPNRQRSSGAGGATAGDGEATRGEPDARSAGRGAENPPGRRTDRQGNPETRWKENAAAQWYAVCMSLGDELGNEIVNRVSDALTDFRGGGFGRSAGALRFPPFCTCTGLVAALQFQLHQLYDAREDLIKAVTAVDHGGQPSDELLAAFSTCTNCNELSRSQFLSPGVRRASGPGGGVTGALEAQRVRGDACERAAACLAGEPKTRGKKDGGRGKEAEKGRCRHCQLIPKIDSLQFFLYSRVEKDVGGIGDEKGLDEGGYHHFGESELLKVVRVLRAVLRRALSERDRGYQYLLRAADEHVKELEAIKKESVAADAYFFASRQVLSALDELHISISRFRLKSREEELAEVAYRRLTQAAARSKRPAAAPSPFAAPGSVGDPFAVSSGEVEPMRHSLLVELGLTAGDLEKAHRQHRFLSHLRDEEEEKLRLPRAEERPQAQSAREDSPRHRDARAEGLLEAAPHVELVGRVAKETAAAEASGDAEDTGGRDGGERRAGEPEPRRRTKSETGGSRRRRRGKQTLKSPKRDVRHKTEGAKGLSNQQKQMPREAARISPKSNGSSSRAARPQRSSSDEGPAEQKHAGGKPASIEEAQDEKAEREEKGASERASAALCPVCLVELEERTFRAVLPCAHQICVECSRALKPERLGQGKAAGVPPSSSPLLNRSLLSGGLSRSSSFSFSASSTASNIKLRRCPVCRRPFSLSQVAFISCRPSFLASSADSSSPYAGSESTPTKGRRERPVSPESSSFSPSRAPLTPLTPPLQSGGAALDEGRGRNGDVQRVPDGDLSRGREGETGGREALRSRQGEICTGKPSQRAEEREVGWLSEATHKTRHEQPTSELAATRGGEREEEEGKAKRDREAEDGLTRSRAPPSSLSARLRGRYSAKLAAIIEKVLEILHESPSPSTPAGPPASAPSRSLSPERFPGSSASARPSSLSPEPSACAASAPSKILIFSEWPAALDLLQEALRRTGVATLKYLGGHSKPQLAKLRCFRHDPDARVLLCSLLRAGRGLTLTEANHVIFLEVPLNLAEEEQAVGRVYRMAQKRQTHVWRFIVKDSVEERIVQMRHNPRDSISARLAASACEREEGDAENDDREDGRDEEGAGEGAYDGDSASNVLLRLGRRLTAGDVALLLGVSSDASSQASQSSCSASSASSAASSVASPPACASSWSSALASRAEPHAGASAASSLLTRQGKESSAPAELFSADDLQRSEGAVGSHVPFRACAASLTPSQAAVQAAMRRATLFEASQPRREEQ